MAIIGRGFAFFMITLLETRTLLRKTRSDIEINKILEKKSSNWTLIGVRRIVSMIARAHRMSIYHHIMVNVYLSKHASRCIYT